MLSSLHIENIAIMDNVDLTFEDGFCVLTGETGAGKSIIIDSVNLLTGERSSRELVRAGADKGIVEGAVFTDDETVFQMLAENGIPYEAGEPLVLSREISKDGRSVGRINGRIATSGLLKGVCAHLINIHGQQDNQAILNVGYHGDYLDSFAGLLPQLSVYADIYDRAAALEKQLSAQQQDAALKAQKADILSFQINEIKRAKVQIGEDETLEEQRNRFVNNEKIVKNIHAAFDALYGSEETAGAYEMLKSASEALTTLSQVEKDAAEPAEQIREMCYRLDDVIETIRYMKDATDLEGLDIDAVEMRIDLLNGLKKKYGGDLQSVLAFLKNAETELDQIENAESYQGKLQQELDACRAELQKQAAELTAARKKAAEVLSAEVCKQLKELDMEKVRFFVAVEQDDYGKKGCDRVEFLISTNPGEPLKPLIKVASGGELSRVILALKVVLSETDDVTTMIFDEVDTGVSGRAADKIGQKLRRLSENKQVFVITHLPQIASYGQYHYLIQKKQSEETTHSEVTLLKEEERVAEIARLSSGEVITDHALEAAKELLEMGKTEWNK